MLSSSRTAGPTARESPSIATPPHGRHEGLALLARSHYEWGRVRDGLASAFGGDPEPEVRASHAVFVIDTDAERAQDWLRERHPSCG